MASKHLCSACLRTLWSRTAHQTERSSPALSVQSRSHLSHQSRPGRHLSTSRALPTDQPPPPPRSSHPKPSSQQDAIINYASKVNTRSAFRSTTEPYIAYGSTEDLYRECARQCDYTIPAVVKEPPEPAPRNAADEHVGEGRGWWYASRHDGGPGLEATFNTWAQVVMLHLYMLTARLRGFPAAHARIWHQHLLDHFFYAAEERMAVWHGMGARGTRNKHLKDLWLQWRGVILSYDEGVIKGDAVLAAAVWRNVFKAAGDVDLVDLAVVTAYMRSQMQMLDRLTDEKVSSGEVVFGDPEAARRALVGMRSAAMNESFSSETAEKVAAPAR